MKCSLLLYYCIEIGFQKQKKTKELQTQKLYWHFIGTIESSVFYWLRPIASQSILHSLKITLLSSKYSKFIEYLRLLRLWINHNIKILKINPFEKAAQDLIRNLALYKISVRAEETCLFLSLSLSMKSYITAISYFESWAAFSKKNRHF